MCAVSPDVEKADEVNPKEGYEGPEGASDIKAAKGSAEHLRAVESQRSMKACNPP